MNAALLSDDWPRFCQVYRLQRSTWAANSGVNLDEIMSSQRLIHCFLAEKAPALDSVGWHQATHLRA
ncbi:hypothetical protein Ddc_08631 [Ditylenchus destructor]|nr:hypothetical protein Ddc_08631 [Ditylenchus destructor]